MSANLHPPENSTASSEVTLCLHLGSATISPRELAQIHQGHIVPLDRDADGDVTVMLHDRVAARGRLVVLHGKMCVQLTEVFACALSEAAD
jgi:flagellar motor switch protein FliN